MSSIDTAALTQYFQTRKDIKFALLFGSQAEQKNNPMSDLDIAIYFIDDLTPLEQANKQVNMITDLMALCKINAIDVVILNSAKPFLKFQVAKQAILLCAQDEKQFYRFKANAFSQYQELKPMYDFYFKKTADSLRRGLHG